MKAKILTIAGVILLLLLVSGTASAAQTKVLLVAAEDGTNLNTIQTGLQSFQDLSTVDFFDARYGTPTLAELQGYNSVLVWSDYNFADRNALGDVLADYVDGG
ncbi:MAG: hypothetical protein QG646_3913 [Euryarchaeota archaeon]|nr:hypothetical protein [Euryarchaeota archaeon]